MSETGTYFWNDVVDKTVNIKAKISLQAPSRIKEIDFQGL